MSGSRLFVITAVVILAVVIGGYVVYDQVLRGDSAAALTLPAASNAPASRAPAASTAPAASAAAGASATAGTSSAPAASFDGAVAGTWNVSTGEAGYRVREKLADLPAESDAIGRTKDVTGSITIETNGSTTTLTAATIDVDTTTIKSDEDRRDNRMRREGLETDTFKTASFKLTQPVEIPAAALTGTPSKVTLTGDLTLHGVTKSVQIPAETQLVDGTIQVAGSLTFPLSDYSIVAPNIGGFIVSIADDGTLEFLVSFTKS